MMKSTENGVYPVCKKHKEEIIRVTEELVWSVAIFLPSAMGYLPVWIYYIGLFVLVLSAGIAMCKLLQVLIAISCYRECDISQLLDILYKSAHENNEGKLNGPVCRILSFVNIMAVICSTIIGKDLAHPLLRLVPIMIIIVASCVNVLCVNHILKYFSITGGERHTSCLAI